MALQFQRPPMTEGTSSGVSIVHLTGRKVSLDEESLDRLQDQLLALADESSDSALLLDFANVECVSGMALGTLVKLHKNLLIRGRRMTIANLSPQVLEVFVVTRLNKFLDLQLAGQAEAPWAQASPCRPLRCRQHLWIEIPRKGV